MGSKKQSSKQKWPEQAEAFNRGAERSRPGRTRRAIAQGAATGDASRINEWVSSPGPDVTVVNRPVQFPSGTIVGYFDNRLEQISRPAVLPISIQ